MKERKRVFALVLCLCLMAPICALASEGDAVLARKDPATGEGFQDYIQFMCVRQDELVLIGNDGVYTWKIGDADLTLHPWSENYNASESEEDDATGEEITRYVDDLAAFSDGEDIYLVRGVGENDDMASEFQYASLWKVVPDGDEAIVEEQEDSELDWEALVDYHDEDSYARTLENCVYIDGVLYGTGYGDSGMEAYAIPLDGSYSEVLDDVTNPSYVVAYKDGKVVFLTFDYDNQKVSFIAWDPQEEEAEELCTLEITEYNYPYGPVYDDASDRMYYTTAGTVVALDLETGETQEVNDMPLPSGQKAAMLPGGYYVLSDYDATVVRNTDPSKRAQYRLSISNPSYFTPINSASYTFSNIRGDVSVMVATGQDTSRIVEDMMNQSAEYDIYAVYMYEQAFDSVYNRGYMAEITGSEKIDKLFEELYPDIAQRLSVNGVPVAVPLYISADAPLNVSKSALEQAGLTMDDIPTNWLDLLDNLDELQAKLADKGVTLFEDWYTAEDVRLSLFSSIMDDYMAYMNKTDPLMGFNTEPLRSVLQKLDEVDFEALGLEPEEDYENGELIIRDSSQYLFELYAPCSISEYYVAYVPLPLGMTPETDGLVHLQIGVAFINPYSQNKETAVQFLECALDNVPEGEIASLCDIEIEPKRSRYYETAKEIAQEELAGIQDALAKAEEDEKQALEEQLQDIELSMEDIENGYWDISAEGIEWYRNHDDVLAINSFNPLYSGDNYDEIGTYIDQYQNGEISAEQMLQNIDKKMQMIIREGN